MSAVRNPLLAAILFLSPLPLFAQAGAYCRARLLRQDSAYGPTAKAETNRHGLNPADLDRSANACVNSFEFADGGWVKSLPSPAAYWSRDTFNSLLDHNQATASSTPHAAFSESLSPR